MTADVDVQVGDTVLFTRATGHWNRDRLYSVVATSVDSISVETDGHRYSIARGDLERLGLTLATTE